jgi:hypothetical protein
MIYRKRLRTILNSAETTEKTDSIASQALAFALGTSDALYLGWHDKFACRYFAFAVLNTASISLSISYWNGTAWTAVPAFVDTTDGFTKNGWVSWTNGSDWAKSNQAPLTDVKDLAYWIRIKVSGALDVATSLQAILNLFCDDVMLREWYPELVTDTRYLPSGRTDFLEQYNAGKNMIVQRLVQAQTIKEEANILNPEDVAIAATHASAYCILNGIPNPSDDLIKWKESVKDSMDFWITDAVQSFDLNKSGEIEPVEENIGFTFVPRG